MNYIPVPDIDLSPGERFLFTCPILDDSDAFEDDVESDPTRPVFRLLALFPDDGIE